jgi:hypothetical protein
MDELTQVLFEWILATQNAAQEGWIFTLVAGDTPSLQAQNPWGQIKVLSSTEQLKTFLGSYRDGFSSVRPPFVPGH